MVPSRSNHPNRRRWLLTALAILVLALVAVGCDTADEDTASLEDADPVQPDEAIRVGLPPIGEVAVDDIPSQVDLDVLEDLPVLSGLAWAMDAIGLEGPPEAEDIEAAVSEEFLAMVSAENFIQQTGPLLADWQVTALLEVEPTFLVAEITAAGEELVLVAQTTEDEPLVLETLALQPPAADAAEFEDWDEATEALTALGERVVYLAATVDDGRCEPIAAQDADQRGPLGSTFKLYVLGAAIDAVDRGDLTWEDELEITEELKSLPSGRLQFEEAGTTVTVAEAAELMIAISDNTATDLLIDVLGREAIEDAQAAYGHDDPSVNQPFLTTREMFQLAAAADDTVAYIEADEDGRRAILSELGDRPLPAIEQLALEASVPQPIEWFASPAEVCELLVRLDEATEQDGMRPARDAFGAEPPPPGVELIGAKAGSQPGVQSRAWLLEDQGRRLAFVLSADHGPGEDAAVTRLQPVVEGAFDLLTAEGQ